MSGSPPGDLQRKRDHFGRAGFAARYRASFEAGRRGQLLLEREEAAIEPLVPRAADGLVLDLPSGSGRIGGVLRRHGYRVISADQSAAMLTAGGRPPGTAVRADAGRLPFADAVFDGVLSYRFFYHFAQPGPFISEIHRVLKPGGWLCFDVVRWSPSQLARAFGLRSGGLVYIHRDSTVRTALARCGFEIVGRRDAFLINPALAYYLPGPAARIAAWVEPPRPLPRAKTYWLARRI